MFHVNIMAIRFRPTEDGLRDDERTMSDNTWPFDDVAECVEYLRKRGITEVSSGPEFGGRGVWYSETYDDPEGYVIETTAHATDDVSEETWRAVWAQVTDNGKRCS